MVSEPFWQRSHERASPRPNVHDRHEVRFEEDEEEEERPPWQRRQRPFFDNQGSYCSFKLPFFQGRRDPTAYLEWERKMELLFEYKDFTDDKKVRFAPTQFTDYAVSWWDQELLRRRRNGEPRVTTWKEMRALMRNRYAPDHYYSDRHQWQDQGKPMIPSKPRQQVSPSSRFQERDSTIYKRAPWDELWDEMSKDLQRRHQEKTREQEERVVQEADIQVVVGDLELKEDIEVLELLPEIVDYSWMHQEGIIVQEVQPNEENFGISEEVLVHEEFVTQDQETKEETVKEIPIVQPENELPKFATFHEIPIVQKEEESYFLEVEEGFLSNFSPLFLVSSLQEYDVLKLKLKLIPMFSIIEPLGRFQRIVFDPGGESDPETKMHSTPYPTDDLRTNRF